MRLDSLTSTELTLATVAVWVAFTAVVGFMDDRNQILGSPSKAHAAFGDQGERGKGPRNMLSRILRYKGPHGHTEDSLGVIVTPHSALELRRWRQAELASARRRGDAATVALIDKSLRTSPTGQFYTSDDP